MELHFTDEVLEKTKGKVIVLTGGAQGIGGSLVKMAYEAGAHVFFGDWDDDKGRALETHLRAGPGAGAGGTVTFQHVDVRDYKSQLALFAAAHAAHGRIDTAVPLAAGGEPRGWFEPDTLTIEKLQDAEPAAIRDRLEINVLSVVYFCRIAFAYMRNPEPAAAARDFAAGKPLPRSIVLLSSLAGLTENPGVPVYVASKHAIMGLLRSFAPYAPVRYGVRVNAMCPSATNTRMIDSLADSWTAAGLPLNQPEDVARLILLCATDERRNGNAVYVSGGQGVDIEEGYNKTMPVWMGLQHTIDVNRAREFSGLGDGWVETATSWQEN